VAGSYVTVGSGDHHVLTAQGEIDIRSPDPW